MDLGRTTAISELDSPRASVDRDVATYLSVVSREQERFVDTLATATALLAGRPGRLPAAAAGHVRMTQRFLDAQRSILRLWADTDAKVTRMTETATLEAAMLGLDAQAMMDLPAAAETTTDHELRRLLERWWELARTDSTGMLEETHAVCDRVLAVARLAAGEVSSEDGGELADDVDHVDVPGDVQMAAPQLPTGIVEALAGHDGGPLHGVLDELAALLGEPSAAPQAGGPEPGHDAGDVRPVGDLTVPPQPPDGFDRFWSSNRSTVALPTPRRIVRDGVVPMLVVTLLLVALLVVIG